MDLSSQDRPLDENGSGPAQGHPPRTPTTSNPNSSRPWSADFSNPLPDTPPRRQRPISELTRSPTNLTRPVRIRRLPSDGSLVRRAPERSTTNEEEEEEVTGRRRSLSAPQRPTRAHLANHETRRDPPGASYLLPVMEETPDDQDNIQQQNINSEAQQPNTPIPAADGLLRRASNAALSVLGGRSRGNSVNRRSRAQSNVEHHTREYDNEVIDFLDVIDPEVSTLTTLNNVQNSLFIPYLGPLLNRQQTYDLSHQISTDSETESDLEQESRIPQQSAADAVEVQTSDRPISEAEKSDEPGEISSEWQGPDSRRESLRPLARSDTLSSVLSGVSIGHRYAVLPHGTVLDGWTAEDKALLNDHVRHLLHSRRARFKRTMRAFGKYVRTPLGFFVTLYAFLLTFWGAAWVLFLIGWISAGDRQKYFIEICDQILTALFACVGLGLAPFRAVDTYHMIYIAHYHYLTWELRRRRGLPDLIDPNELPAPMNAEDIELAHEKQLESVVLTPEQQKKLVHHQTKFSKSHTFYKPQETYTHRAFSIKLLITIVVLLDCHSLFQMALGGTTWGIYYKHRPKALTAVILTCSICCNIAGGVVISIGDRMSRKKEVVTQLARQALTEEAMKKIKKKRGLRTFVRVKGVASEAQESGKGRSSKKKSRRKSKPTAFEATRNTNAVPADAYDTATTATEL